MATPHLYRTWAIIGILGLALAATSTQAVERMIDGRMHHLRSADDSGGEAGREWAEFPEQAEAAELIVAFDADGPTSGGEQTLWIRQHDVKQIWHVTLNDVKLGDLERDEKDITRAWPLPPGSLKAGKNTLTIAVRPKSAVDDIRVGNIRLDPRPVAEVLNEVKLEVVVSDRASREPLPSRITIVDDKGSLVSLGVELAHHLAIRTGTVYALTGRANIGVPAGRYTLHASRGFEYSVERWPFDLKAGHAARVDLELHKEANPPGFVSVDTHVHTFTFSRHGDATLTERMVTLAAEGIEVPVATDHNVHIDYRDEAKRLGADRWFTPAMGSEVTTKVGHFNIFPVAPESRPADWKPMTWAEIFDNIHAVPGVQVVILNHGRDVHYGFRPMGPAVHNAVTGENLAGWTPRFNAMELVNSAATMGDPMRLVHDWMGLLNRGHRIAPIGSSDSHDVSRHMVGQGRTYVKYDDDADPSKIDVTKVAAHLAAGKAIASYGLAALLEVDGKYGPGDLVPATSELKAKAIVAGPSWTTANHVALYSNGQLLREKMIDVPADADGRHPIVKFTHEMTLPRPKHDVHLVLVARGPGITGPHFPLAKPYQPTSIEWEPYVMSVCGAVYLDIDGDGEFTSPYAYAVKLIEKHGDDGPLINALADYDEAVAAQAASLLLKRGRTVGELTALAAIAPSKDTWRGIEAFLAAHRENEAAKQKTQ